MADKEFVCAASVGIALAPSDGDNAATLLRHADIALTRAKADGGQRMRCFEPGMDKALQRRRMVEHELGWRSTARSSRSSINRNMTS